MQAAIACVDVIPLFLDLAPGLKIADEEITITSTSSRGKYPGKARYGVFVHHIPTGISVNCSGKWHSVALGFGPCLTNDR